MDAGAALRPAEIEVRLGQWIYTIPALPAADWIEALLSEDGWAIVPGLFEEEDQVDVWREFLAGHVDRDELREAWQQALAAATGHTWWSSARLVLAATHRDAWPSIHAKLIEMGFDPQTHSIGAFWNSIYLIGRRNCESDTERAGFEFQVNTPPPEVKAQDALAELDAGDDFMAAMGAFQTLQAGQMPT